MEPAPWALDGLSVCAVADGCRRRNATPCHSAGPEWPHDISFPCSNWIPYGFQSEVMKRSSPTPEPRTRAGETEKMTVNVGVVDLGHVDLLVQEGFYSNRSDLVRTALRNQLALHADTLKATVARRTAARSPPKC